MKKKAAKALSGNMTVRELAEYVNSPEGREELHQRMKAEQKKAPANPEPEEKKQKHGMGENRTILEQAVAKLRFVGEVIEGWEGFGAWQDHRDGTFYILDEIANAIEAVNNRLGPNSLGDLETGKEVP